MNAKITLVFSLAVLATAAASPQYVSYGYDIRSYNRGPSNDEYSSSSVETGIQEATNQHSAHSSNDNNAYDIVAKSALENTKVAQSEKYAEQPAPAPAPKY